MCGMVGIAGDLEFHDKATMKRLLLLDFFRGTDSTGLAGVRRDGEINIAKIASHPLDLFDSLRFLKALVGTEGKVLMGHNRAATRGVVNSYNAHPYHIDHIVGTHNGTLSTVDQDALEDALGEKFSNDSQAIFAGIARLGVRETIQNLTEGATASTGAWSLVWYDEEDCSLNFLRNKHRPMWLAYSKDFKKMFWASEWGMIDSATNLSSKEYPLYTNDKGYQYWATPKDQHLKFNVNDFLNTSKKKKPKPKMVEIKGKEAKKVESKHDPFPKRGPSGTSPSSTTKSHSRVPRLLKLIGDDVRPLAGVLSRDEFDRIAKSGCAWCSQPVEIDDPGLAYYERDEILLCPEHSGINPEKPVSRIYVEDISKLK